MIDMSELPRAEDGSLILNDLAREMIMALHWVESARQEMAWKDLDSPTVKVLVHERIDAAVLVDSKVTEQLPDRTAKWWIRDRVYERVAAELRLEGYEVEYCKELEGTATSKGDYGTVVAAVGEYSLKVTRKNPNLIDAPHARQVSHQAAE